MLHQQLCIVEVFVSVSLWPPYVIGQAICIFILCFLLFSFFFSSPNLSGRRLDVYRTWCGLSVNLECRSETCCARLAENTARKKSSKSRHLGTIPQLCRSARSTGCQTVFVQPAWQPAVYTIQPFVKSVGLQICCYVCYKFMLIDQLTVVISKMYWCISTTVHYDYWFVYFF